MISRPHFYMYYNNTKENKNNKNLKLQLNLLQSSLPSQLVILSFQRVNSLQNTYILRIQNMANPDDIYNNHPNVAVANLNKVVKALKLASIEEVSLFGVNNKQGVEEQRFIWTGEDGVSSGGFVRQANDINKVEFLPQQIRTFILSAN